ncbi:NAD(P)-binding protein [Setomelanomma holmii]|uniref:NAD(P)-binding protein n=1 Tax=Setomelanomma holmii TaxID=210430 RepID=A0A9P4LLX9_9PLEO|nr:NAD(P)-binding protein [Setomelanomma holmii]
MPPPQRILLIGGATGIGAATTISLITQSNALVFMMDKFIDYSPDGPLGALTSYPNRMYGHEGDVTVAADREKAVELCVREDILGGIDTVVYCAGVLGPIERVESLDIEGTKYAFEVNVFGPMAMAQLTLPYLKAARQTNPLNYGYGKMISLSSACDQTVTYHSWSSYCSSKAALTRFISCLAHEEPGISVQGVYPKLTRTSMIDGLVGDKALYDGIMAKHEIEKFKIWDRMGDEMVEPPEWCGEAVAKLALGLSLDPGGRRHPGRCKELDRKLIPLRPSKLKHEDR